MRSAVRYAIVWIMADAPESGSGGIPTRLGRYALITELPGGALGTRWAAHVTEGEEQGRLVTLRRVALRDSKSRAGNWLHDAGKRAMQIRHPKVVAVLDVVQAPGEVAIVGEYLEGEALSSLLRLSVLEEVPLPVPVALGIVRDLLEALQAARKRWDEQVKGNTDPLRLAIHGGITPDVIMVAQYGEAMLLDVGLAGAGARLLSVLKDPSALAYRAPEQLKRTSPVDEHTDVYSLGVVLWEMLASRPLFGAPDRLRHPGSDRLELAQLHELEDQILKGPVARLDEVSRRGAPLRAEVVELVARALARRPEERFAGLDDMRSALEALPRETVASAEQIAVTADRLGRALLDSRRVAIETATGARVMQSSPPESTRSTRRPAPPSRPITMLVAPTPLADVLVGGPAEGVVGRSEGPAAPSPVRTAQQPSAPAAQVGGLTERGFGWAEGPTMPSSVPGAQQAKLGARPARPERQQPPRLGPAPSRLRPPPKPTLRGLGALKGLSLPSDGKPVEHKSAAPESVERESIDSLKLSPLPPRYGKPQAAAGGAAPARPARPDGSQPVAAPGPPQVAGTFASDEAATAPSAPAAAKFPLQPNQVAVVSADAPAAIQEPTEPVAARPAAAVDASEAAEVSGPTPADLSASAQLESSAQPPKPESSATPQPDLSAPPVPVSLMAVETRPPERRARKRVLLAAVALLLVAASALVVLRAFRSPEASEQSDVPCAPDSPTGDVAAQ
jgi:serine/threonine protein kinase